jgi:hypothetical protein
MLVRVKGTNPPFVAGIVFGVDTERVMVTAPILKWARGMTEEQLRKELKRRGLTASYVRTLTREEMKSDTLGSTSNTSRGQTKPDGGRRPG